MALWPFKKRAKTNSGEKIGVGSRKNGHDPLIKKKHQGHSQTPDAAAPLITPMNHSEFVGAPQKQVHQNGFSSYFLEISNTNSSSSISSQLPHKPNMSKRSAKIRCPNTAEDSYITPPTSGGEDSQPKPRIKFGRSSSSRDGGKGKFKRTAGQPPVPQHADSALLSNNSIMPLKPEIKRLEVLAPRPKLYFGYEASGTPNYLFESKAGPHRPKRLNLEGKGRPRGIPTELLEAGSRVDSLADEMDAKGIREVLERDKRRRERKKLADRERIQKRMENRLRKQKAAQEEIRDEAYYLAETSFAGPSNPRPGLNSSQWGIAPTSAATQTPLSWLRDPSVEDLTTTPHLVSKKPSPTRGNQSQAALVNPSLPSYPNQIVADLNLKGNAQYCQPNDLFQFEKPNPTDNDGTQHQGRSRWTSFLKKATASRLRKEQVNREFRISQSILVSDSEGELDDRPKTARNQKFGGLEHISQPSVSNKEVQRASTTWNAEGSHRPHGSYDDFDNQSGEIGLALTHEDEVPRPESRIIPSSPQLPSPTLPNASRCIRHTPSPQFTHRSIPDGRNTASRASRYSSGAVSPAEDPSAIQSQSLASIDSEGSWLSGKVSRQSVSRLAPLQTSVNSLRQRFRDHESEEGSGGAADADDYFGAYHDQPFLEEEEEEVLEDGYDHHAHRNEESMLNLSDDEGSYDDTVVPRPEIWREGIAKSPQIHKSAWRPKSREGVLKSDDEEPPSSTAATAGYDTALINQNSYATRLEHPFAQEGQNFVSPLEHFSERRPRYTGAAVPD